MRAGHWLVAFALPMTLLPAPQARGQETGAQPPGSWTYRVQPGDTLWDVSRKYMETPLRWPEIQRGNAVPVPERLQPGQLLSLGSSAAVLHVSGRVTLLRAGAAERPLDAGEGLQPNDVVVTDRDGFLTVGFADGSRVVVPSNSSARLMTVQGPQTRLELLNGRIESYVEKRKEREFEIRTRTFALGVRGTHFRVRSDGNGDAVEVLDGSVVAAELGGQRRRIEVAAREGVPLAADGALAVRRLLPPPQQHLPREKNVVEADAVEGAGSYRLQLAADPDFLKLVMESRAPAPRFALQGKLAPGFYHTRVSAFDAREIEGPASEGVTFAAAPDGPVESTARAAGSGTWEIRWTRRQERRHTLELAKTPDFASPLVAESGTYMSGVTVGPLEGPARYYWRCREEAEGESTLPAEWGGSFEVPAP